MLPLTSAAPTTAERIRSACARAGGALLAVEGARTRSPRRCITCCTTDPSPSRSPPAATGGSPVAGSQALLELTDYAPLPLREPVRSLVWVRGRLQQVPPAAVTETLDLIATEYPNPALLQVETPKSAPCDPDDDPVRAAAARDRLRRRHRRHRRRARQRRRTCSPRGPTRSARSSRACCGTWTPPTTTWSRGWCPDCRRRCAADRSGRSVSTGTACGSASKATTATTTSGCRSTSRSTT